MSYLILVRHSQPQQQPDLPAREWHLSQEGRARCQKLGSELAAKYNPTRIVASSEPKAIETATIIAAFFGLPIEIAADLHEHDRRNVGYLPADEFKARAAALFAHPDELVLGVETANQALTRFEAAVRKLLEQHIEGDLAAVTHGTVMTLFLAHYNPQINPLDFWQQLTLPAVYYLSLPDFQLVG